MTDTALAIKLTNRLGEAHRVILEPWGGEYPIAPGETFDLLVEDAAAHPLVVELLADRLVIHSLHEGNAMLSLRHDGHKLIPE